MTDIARLTVVLEAQTAKYERQLKSVNRKMGRFEKRQKAALRNIAGAFKGLATAVGVRFFASFIRSTIDSTDAIGKMVDRLGGSTEAFSELAHVAEISGVKQNQLNLGLQRMTRRVAEAAVGTGEAVKALKELGLSAERLKSLSIDRQFEVVADRLSAVGDESDKTRLAMKLFDSEGVALLQTMTDGAAGIRKLRQEARDLGLSLSQDMVQRATEAKDAMTRFDGTMRGIGITITSAMLPAITAANNALTNLFNKPISKEIEDLERDIAGLTAELNSPKPFYAGPHYDERRLEQIRKAQERLDELRASLVKYNEAASVAADTAAANAVGAMATQLSALDPPGNIVQKFRELGEWLQSNEMATLPDSLLDSFDNLDSKISDTNSTAQDLGLTFASAFEDAAVAGKKLSEVLKGLLQDMLRILIRRTVTEPLTGFFSDILKREGGGPVSAGSPYLVGEAGPELFVPGASGSIVPNNKMGGGGMVFNIDASGADADRILATLPGVIRQAVDTSVGTMFELKAKGQF